MLIVKGTLPYNSMKTSYVVWSIVAVDEGGTEGRFHEHLFVIDPFFGGVRTGGGLYRYTSRRKNLVEKARGREVVLVQCCAHTHTGTYKKTGACYHAYMSDVCINK